MQDRPAKLMTYQTYIDGKWVDAASGKTFQTFDPYTGEPWALIPECDKVDADRAEGRKPEHWTLPTLADLERKPGQAFDRRGRGVEGDALGADLDSGFGIDGGG